MGPVKAEASVGGIQMRGLRRILGICSMEVPSPWLTRPPTPFSRKDITAKPTICAQQPATAAPPAKPVRDNAAQMAALEMGSVSAMPTATDTSTPIRKGCKLVAHLIKSPTALAAAPMAGAHSTARPQPVRIVTAGVTRISTLVSRLTSFPHSAAIIVMI